MFLRKAQNPFARDAALCRLMSGHGVTLAVQGSVCPQTDGKVIWMPALPLDADEIDIAIHDHSLVHEPAHITEGSFDVDAKNVGQFLHDIWNFIEDGRVEHSQEQTKYPGLRVERANFIGDFRKYADRMGTNGMLKAQFGSNVVRGALCVLLFEMRGSQLGVTPGIDPSRVVLGFYRRHLERHLAAALAADSCRAALDLAKVVHADLLKVIGGGALGDLDKLEEAGKSKPKGPGGLSGEDDEAGEDEDKGDSGNGAGKSHGRDSDDPYEVIDDLEANATPSIGDQTLAIIHESSGAQGWKPGPIGRRKRFDKLTANGAQLLTEAGVQLLGAQGSKMTRLFIANSRPRTVYNRYDGRLDTRAVVSDLHDTRKDLYKVRLRGSTDRAAVSMLYDVSCSMDGVIYQTASILAGLGHYLDRGRIPFDIHAFGTYFHTFKTFEEPWKCGAAQQLVASESHTDGSTATAWAFEQVARGLMARPEGKKVLIVMTDGCPSKSNLEIPYCLRMSKALRSYGAVVIGIGLGVSLKSMFGEDFIKLPKDGTGLGAYLCSRIEQILSRKTQVR